MGKLDAVFLNWKWRKWAVCHISRCQVSTRSSKAVLRFRKMLWLITLVEKQFRTFRNYSGEVCESGSVSGEKWVIVVRELVVIFTVVASFKVGVGSFGSSSSASDDEASQETADEEPVGPIVTHAENPHFVEVSQQQIRTYSLRTFVWFKKINQLRNE